MNVSSEGKLRRVNWDTPPIPALAPAKRKHRDEAKDNDGGNMDTTAMRRTARTTLLMCKDGKNKVNGRKRNVNNDKRKDGDSKTGEPESNGKESGSKTARQYAIIQPDGNSDGATNTANRDSGNVKNVGKPVNQDDDKARDTSAPKTTQRMISAVSLRTATVIYPGWEPLDVFGPLQLFFSISTAYKLTLSVIAKETGPVSAGYPPHIMAAGQPPMDLGFMLQPKLVATHSFGDAPALDVLLVPGGFGNVALDQSNDTSIQTFLRNRFDSLDYLLSICTGSVLLASSGLLNGHRATTNKMSWDWVTSRGENVKWVPSARWTQDGKIWTSSGVAAGIDMMYAFLKHLYGESDPVLIKTMNGIEYAPHTDLNWDPFSIVHNVPGHTNGSLESCVKPVGA
ncbi:hypothetical protein VTI74DRAFT_10151 [Chaetomium olivicolor]